MSQIEKIKATLFKVNVPVKDGWGSATYTVAKAQATPSVTEYGKPHMTNGKIDYYYINANGTLIVPKNEFGTFVLVGSWTEHNGYHDFKVSVSQPYMSTRESSIRKLLCSSAFPGIGKKKANAIVDAFGKDTWEVLKNTPEKLNEVKELSANDIAKVRKAYKECAIVDFAEYLSQYDIPYGSKMRRLYNDFDMEENPLKLVKENPYILLNFKGISFKQVDAIGKANGLTQDNPDRVLGAILYVLNVHYYTRNNMCVHKDKLKSDVLRQLNNDMDCKDWIDGRYFDLVLKDAINSGRVMSVGDYIYMEPAYREETNVIADVKGLLEAKTERCGAPSVAFSGLSIDNSQKNAVESTLQNRICVITGGAGTGKTTVIKIVVNSFRGMYPNKSVTLLAPTGKAARRLEETTGEKAMTIHSALRIYDEENLSDQILPEGLVVVDEASMVDCSLMETLLGSCRNTDYHLCIVGDKDQLQSVGAGRIFADFIASHRIPVVTLETVYRQNEDSKSILRNADYIRRGLVEQIHSDNNPMANDNHFVIIGNLFSLPEAQQLEQIERYYRHAIERFGVENVSVICPLRRKNTQGWLYSSESLNPMLQNMANPAKDSTLKTMCHGVEFRINDRVMQTQNTADCSNGDVGTITNITGYTNEETNETKTMVSITFDNGSSVSYDKEDMETIELAYAMTVHKSQGSEYDCVLVFLPDNEREKYPMIFSRSLLYTAVTRAKQTVLTFATEETLRACIENEESDKRVSLLAERLQIAIPEPKQFEVIPEKLPGNAVSAMHHEQLRLAC